MAEQRRRTPLAKLRLTFCATVVGMRETNKSWIKHQFFCYHPHKMLDLDLLRTFVFVAETGSLSQAAARVLRTQSAVSMQMQRLEGMVGKALLERSGRGVRLTAAGERMLRQAHKLLRLHDETILEVSGEGLTGLARFGLADDYAEAFLPPLVGGFAARFPHVGVEVSCSPTPDLQRGIRSKRLDLAILTLAANTRGKALRKENLVWVGAMNASAELINPLPLALSHREAIDRRLALQALRRVGRRYRIAYESGSSSGLIAVVRSGLAIAILARCSVPKDLRILTKTDGLPSLPNVDIVLAVSSGASPPARRLAEHVSSLLPMLVF
jgi:DNA-binding transcriptional LysR family regulator